MVRLLHVTLDDRYEPLRGGGGVARYIHGLSVALSRLGAQVTVAADAVDDEGLPYRTAAASGFGLLRHMRQSDVVHVHGGRRAKILFAAALAWAMGKPFIYTPHAYYAPNRPAGGLALTRWRFREWIKAIYNQTAERFLLSCGYRTILLNQSWLDEVRVRMRLPVHKAIILPNCALAADFIDLPLKARAPLAGRPSILSVGRLDEVKHLDDVIRALTLPGLGQAVFHVVGKGADRRRLEACAQVSGVADRAVFYGVLDDAQVADMAAGADVFILPARQEGMPSVIIEMLLRRVPVVCSDIPGSRAIMDLAGAPWIFPVSDVRALAEVLQTAVAEPVTDDMHARVNAHLTWERRAPDFLKLYVDATASAS